MPFDSVQVERLGGAWGALESMLAADGSAGHQHLQRLLPNGAPLRDLADSIHLVCLLHARHPDVIELAAAHTEDPSALGWLSVAAEAFAAERAYIVRLVAAAGPLPSTPGQAESEAAVAGQRHALDMLAQSDRVGCATGAALALALGWAAVRLVLDGAAHRLGITPPESQFPPEHETATVVQEFAQSVFVERAMLFGAQQLFAQHRGLWDLLEARASARGKH